MKLSVDVFSEMLRSRSIRYCLPLLLAGGVAWAQDSEAIARIEVLGAQKLTPETVIFKSGLKVGDDLRAIDLTAVLQQLWSSGSFDDIKFELADGTGGKTLTIRVVERPLIKEVDYRGGTEIGVSNLKDKVKEKKLTINPDTVYDPEAARKIKGIIVEQAAEKGFRNPVVDVSLEAMGPGLARLVFDIKEGGKAKIYRITFRGNKVISSSRLARAMEKTGAHGIFSWIGSKDLLVEKNLEEDVQNIKKVYWREGYKDVFVGQPLIEVEDRTTPRQKKKNEKLLREAKSPKYDLRANLTIPILEGEKFYEGKFKVEGNTKVFKGQRGEDFYRTKIAEVRRDNRSIVAKWLNLKPSIEDLPADKNRPFDLDGLNQGIEKLAEEHKNQ
ncbi:MAG: outer membrane protein, family, partial [Holophagaceae bacterium]|nr:outer membrane protein, family [Holophagaceae bacterium]